AVRDGDTGSGACELDAYPAAYAAAPACYQHGVAVELTHWHLLLICPRAVTTVLPASPPGSECAGDHLLDRLAAGRGGLAHGRELIGAHQVRQGHLRGAAQQTDDGGLSRGPLYHLRDLEGLGEVASHADRSMGWQQGRLCPGAQRLDRFDA